MYSGVRTNLFEAVVVPGEMAVPAVEVAVSVPASAPAPPGDVSCCWPFTTTCCWDTGMPTAAVALDAATSPIFKHHQTKNFGSNI
jgi:hypothetical protein